jgi:hypothetical protein
LTRIAQQLVVQDNARSATVRNITRTNAAANWMTFSTPIEFVEEFFVRRHIHGANASYDEATVSREYLRTIRDHIRRSRG